MKRIILLLGLVLILAGCNSASQTSIADAEAALESGDFDTALKHYNQALLEDDSPQLKKQVDLLHNYEDLQTKMADAAWSEASQLANDLLEDEAIAASLEEEVEGLLETINEGLEKEEQVAATLKEAEEQIDNEELEEASSTLSELENEIESEAFASELEDLQKQLEAANERVAKQEQQAKEAEERVVEREQQDKEAAAEQKRQEEEAKQRAETEPEKNDTASSSGVKQTYLAKANELDNQMQRDIDDPNIQDWIGGFYFDYYREWDELLNEVWGAVKDTLPEAEFNVLLEEQREWIQVKEQTFDAMPQEPASARVDSQQYLALETKERTYYLIEYLD